MPTIGLMGIKMPQPTKSRTFFYNSQTPQTSNTWSRLWQRIQSRRSSTGIVDTSKTFSKRCQRTTLDRAKLPERQRSAFLPVKMQTAFQKLITATAAFTQ
jgi:hypothetical protein